MKLLYCEKCMDIILLTPEIRECRCGECAGFYEDEISAVVSGPAICLGFANNSFMIAKNSQPKEGMGIEFTAFVIPKKASTIKRVDDARQEYSRNMFDWKSTLTIRGEE